MTHPFSRSSSPRALVSFLLLGPLLNPAWLPAQQTRKEAVVRVAVNEVVLDVVVTDKKGRSIRDLTNEDFEVFEDGVVQQVLRLRKVETGAAVDQPANAQPASQPQAFRSEELPQINMITLIFDRISLYGRKMAREAAQKYIKQMGPDDMISVMVIDRRLQVITPYTRDPARLSAAIDLAVSGTSEQFDDASAAIRQAAEQYEQASAAAQAGISQVGRDTGGPSAGTRQAFAEAEMTEAVVSMLRRSAAGEQVIQGLATIESLINVVRGQRGFPGRKAVIFFAETLALPVRVQERFKDLISLANRDNVSFYSIDTSGLEQEGQLDRMNDELEHVSGVSRNQQRKRAGAVTQEEVFLAENVNNVLTMSSQNSLAGLAESTGGFLVANTNDLLPGLTSVSEDLRFHYELTYTPTNGVYDGAFRKIDIKVKRPGTVIRGREGYYALPANELAEAPYELPLLEALRADPRPAEIAFRSSSFLFPTSGARSEAVLYLETPLSELQFQVDTKKNEYSAKTSLLIAVRGDNERVVEKFSQEFPFQGPAAKVEETKKRNLLFYRTADLAPGRYVIETAVRDEIQGKTGVKRAVLIVPGPTETKLKISSIVTVKRVDSVEEDAELTATPLGFGDKKIIPYLESTMSQADWSDTAFYFTVRAPQNTDIFADVVLYRDGKLLGHMGEKLLPRADRHGEIRYLAALPLQGLEPGNYNVEVVAHDTASTVVGRTVFLLE